MDEAIIQIHNAAMDLSELARIRQARDGTAVSQTDLKAAYELELQALSKIGKPQSDNDRLWQAIIIQSAGWLALKCGYAEQAKSLATTGLSISTDGYVLSKLEKLKSEADRVIGQK